MQAKAFLKAVREYDAAFVLDAAWPVTQRKYVDALITVGLNDYAQKKIYAALGSWQHALRLDPSQFQAHFYATKARLDIDAREQTRAITEAHVILQKTKDKLVRADVYNMLGDIYYKQQEFVTARAMYQRSKDQFNLVKKIINFQAFRGLQGL
jgi:tetratricopeptide (TPR) repeat protein